MATWAKVRLDSSTARDQAFHLRFLAFSFPLQMTSRHAPTVRHMRQKLKYAEVLAPSALCDLMHKEGA